ncbi:erv1 / Alr family domain-containing protein, putative [Eimeria tenella]|uniref:Sulfhydryl oxidase n=1 Tax=Eimeria tenella TaxID=5802 RepID=U6KYW7_EIMTE|nr:erv1 / Alr family domain-containing protein, putative [Eimeria tenella]CDJ41499.1 erv1 / Alr family domain-containing protein, putative [Eimeria tenella]|eukprot:XP_013232249.1 erv1 / Alr family domain-containing protein, putative [Eimeria tenella]
MKPLRLWEAKEATGPSRRRAPSWFVGTENLLQAALQGLAKSIGPPCPSLFRSVVCRLRSSLASPIMPSAPAALQGTPTPAEKPRAAEVHPDSTSADSYGGKASADSSAATGTPFKLHFCEETNEPEDVCNAQWLVLWSYAAYAPERPSPEEQQLLRTFFEFFPDQCIEGPAANCYAEAVRSSAPRVQTRRELLLWLCMVENQCRQKAGMPLKQCRYNDLMRRWRYADGYV